MPSVLEAILADVYQASGFTVRQVVGNQPGEVVWLASSSEGGRRSTVLFQAVQSHLDFGDDWLANLDRVRVFAQADRAVAIVLDSAWRSEELRNTKRYVLEGHHVEIQSFRRWLLNTTGIDRYVREFVDRYERSGAVELRIPRKARIADEIVEATPHLLDWVLLKSDQRLVVTGYGKTNELLYVAYEINRRYLSDPDSSTPIAFFEYVFHSSDDLDLPSEVPLTALAAAVSRDMVVVICPDHVEWSGGRALLEATDTFSVDSLPVLLLENPAPKAILEWLTNKIDSSQIRANLRAAFRQNPAFAALCAELGNARLILKGILKWGKSSPLSTERWLVEVIGAYVDEVLDEYHYQDPRLELAKGAYELYRWGDPSTLIGAGGTLTRAARLWDIHAGRIRFDIVRDYLLGVHVASDRAIMPDGPLPRFALHSIAVLAPEIAADWTIDDVKRSEESIENEVSNKLQLTFQHILNRPVGMLRQSIQEIREGLDDQSSKRLALKFEDVDKQLNHIADLAEKIRLWQGKVEGALEDVGLLSFVTNVTRMLRDQYSTVQTGIEIDPSIFVHVIDHAFEEILHNVLENAFHAAIEGTALPPQVSVRARAVGQTVIVEIEDSGIGIRPMARDKIFEPFHTTKKGGRGKPRGTGLGLPIVRKYIRAMGGRVELLSDRERTTFLIELIGYRRNP